MPYRRTKRAAQGRTPGELRAVDLPNLRRTVIVIDRDFALRVTRLDLWRTRRVDSYMVHVDGVPWKRMGWSKLLEALRKSHVRVGSPRSME